MKKLRVGVLFGGRSGEHEVSLLSAASVMKAMDPAKFEVVPIGITKDGRWITSQHAEALLKGTPPPTTLRAGDPGKTMSAAVLAKGSEIIVPPVPTASDSQKLRAFQDAPAEGGRATAIEVDVIFPVLHGTFGEDGTVQGLLELADIAYVGAGVLGSACGMDKDVMKKLFAQAGLPIVKHLTILRGEWESDPKATTKKIEKALKYPLFVKPANLGSSVGISKVRQRNELKDAMELAAGFDRKIIVEQGVGGVGGKNKAREIECSVLGNDEPEASVAGEIVPGAEFYDYAAKYLDEGSQLVIPAKLPAAKMKEVQQLAVRAFQAVDCQGLARVDFLMDAGSQKKPGKIYVNEINTMPGFTSISMYPKLWAASGLAYPQLIARLIQLALDRHADKKKNQYSR
ncbi:MAG: D-alanine--D-alanine ligase [Candidatus Koribacter versatilis]|uniref:D-alanine--D-alanine ligase n=1 Tax=Candidatus Korobacter versatilis TaxID=658062 RepID=A0A932A9H3_9BACT|nr:D-alanine--D-alanine ligase [Candidatus Koribacter versatilis]